MRPSQIMALAEKLLVVLEEENASPADGNTALLYTLVLSMQLSRPESGPEEVANFLYGRILELANEIKSRM